TFLLINTMSYVDEILTLPSTHITRREQYHHALRPSPTLGLKAKFFSPENLAFSPETVFLLQPFWPKILAQIIKERI
ncbi:hypothetical protein KJ032_26990, partial [Salmonella enterica subsp. enterica serovar Typhimurium]|nr:hypothetical protein [Salmonella enterica subsp. enterica serovar Typhimurium]